MYDLFYILEVTPQWYNLIIKDTHYCIGCGGDLDNLKRTIYNYVRKYKTKERVFRALNSLEDRGKVASSVYDLREKVFRSGQHLVFNDLIRGVVAEALKDNRQDTPYNRTKRKVGTITPICAVASPLPPPNEVRVVKKVTPCKIKRTTV